MNFIGLDNSDTGVTKVKSEVTVSATHAAVLFLLDESGSMAGDSIDSLNNAINRFPQDVCANNGFAHTNIEIAVMAFSSSVRLVSDWKQLSGYTPVSLSAHGGTNLGKALDAAIDKAKAKLNDSKINTVHIVLISDGCGGSVKHAAREIAKMKSEGTLVFWMLGVPGYDSQTANELTNGERLYVLQPGKQFDYTDFITLLASAVVRIQNTPQPPKLKNVPEAKQLGISDSGSLTGSGKFGGDKPKDGGSGSGGSFGGGSFGGGKFGGGI